MSTSSSAEALRAAHGWASGWAGGRHVLVSGGTSGIGAAIARAFLSAGAHVTCTGAGAADIARANADPALQGADLKALDVRDKDAVAAFFAGLDALDILVNCAGVIRRGAELDPEIFAEVVDINLNGSMRMAAGARPLLARQGGSIVNTASMLSFFGGGLVPGYSASKGGIAQLTRSLAIAYAPDAIRVNAIAPGWIRTPLTEGLTADKERSAAIEQRTPLGRWGEPEDLVGGVFFLASPLAAYVTGTILPIDGGYLCV
ncbi:2-deoxy-D-gluconate 3-dehydrogenase [Aureimonas altamirensis]|uniref:2-deoxy-D-gluconate 3-dehydrogenase n=1 Tax=Aureimonas altamirensis TaxID=370622 RepID=A0A0B1PXS9_9HYPH|nr:SDR family oxidoreductase [Aureimonas altamirensis]KHJ53338.1 2-deoxy-D-gluconate 3-dehydrogenase [Aureimonas altamirensis]